MIPIFESILPIFLLVLLGVALKRSPFVAPTLWEGLEQLGYYVMFPALLFVTLYRADFAGLAIGTIAAVTMLAIVAFSALTLALWPALKRLGTGEPAYSTIFQTSTRWNAFIALAVADKLFGADGLALVALVMAIVIIPINLINVSVLIWFGPGTRKVSVFLRRLVTNPLILGCLAGIAMRFVPGGLYGPVEDAISLIAQAALGLGLLMVGAGLRIRDALTPRLILTLPVVLKLLAFPALMVGIAFLCGLSGDTLVLLALCGAVPTAMNGYLLARQMGGDAPLYAAITTVQTAASFLTIPLVLALAAQLASG